MSHPSKVDVLIRAKSAGFHVALFFVGTNDPRTNIDRVAIRVAQGGHDVPRDRIVARWTRTMELLHRAIIASDETFVFDNSVTVPFAAGPHLVFRRSCDAERNPEIQQFVPVPDWVRHYVLSPLQIRPVRSEK